MSYELFMEYYQQMQEILANNIFQEYGIIGLFLNSLLAATAIPLPTEILTSALLIGGENIFLVAIVLIIGSVIGGILNYFIGLGGNKLVKKMKKKSDIEKHEKKHNRLLDKFSAGVKKMEFKKFSIFMVSGKIIKTIIVVIGLGTIF